MRHIILCSLIAVLSLTLCRAGEIVLPASALERDAPVTAYYRTNSRATGKGSLSIRWSDAHGRVVEDRQIPVELLDETDVGFLLDLRRAAAMKNDLLVRFSFDGVDQKGNRDKREEEAHVSFVARPPDRTWWDYAIIMWQQHSSQMFAQLKKLGINAGEYSGRSKAPPEFLLDNDLRWYAENIATDFYSEYHRWYPDRPVNWAFLKAKELYKKDPAGKEAFKRHPSFSDPIWLKKIHDRLVESARAHSPYRPVFYSLGDETGIADLAAFWDFDFSDHSLAGMRVWLKERYGTLSALNRQWGTDFSRWDFVIPMTTNEAMKRADENFSSWADHKEWMDISYARALKTGADAIRSVDPDACVGIGGAQTPGWGGYDYARVTQALTAIEPYDIGNNIEIIRSLNPGMAVVTTSFASGPWEKHRVWYELLHGNRGLILWDDKAEYVTQEGVTGRRGQEAEPYYNEIRNGIGALLINSQRLADPIAIHYSQPSMRTEWMLAQKPKGEAWVQRTSSSEYKDSNFLRLRESWCRLIEDQGLQYKFVSYEQVERGELLRGGYRVLILPRSSSLSEQESRAIREFAQQGGVVLADGEPGAFDEHSRKLGKPLLADLFGGTRAGPVTTNPFGRGKAIHLNVDLLNYHQLRLTEKEGELYRLVGGLLSASGVRPQFTVRDESDRPVVGVETHLFRNGGVTILGLLSNPQLRVDELGPPEFKSNQRFEKPRMLKLGFPVELHVCDARAAKFLGRKKELTVRLEPYEPVILALSPSPVPALRVVAPERLKRGETGQLGLSLEEESPAGSHIFHVEVVDPSGKVVPHYSGNVIAPNGRCDKLLPLAVNDAPGRWVIRVKDVLSGQTQTAAVEVF